MQYIILISLCILSPHILRNSWWSYVKRIELRPKKYLFRNVNRKDTEQLSHAHILFSQRGIFRYTCVTQFQDSFSLFERVLVAKSWHRFSRVRAITYIILSVPTNLQLLNSFLYSPFFLSTFVYIQVFMVILNIGSSCISCRKILTKHVHVIRL